MNKETNNEHLGLILVLACCPYLSLHLVRGSMVLSDDLNAGFEAGMGVLADLKSGGSPQL